MREPACSCCYANILVRPESRWAKNLRRRADYRLDRLRRLNQFGADLRKRYVFNRKVAMPVRMIPDLVSFGRDSSESFLSARDQLTNDKECRPDVGLL